jgi:hypothetical protein
LDVKLPFIANTRLTPFKMRREFGWIAYDPSARVSMRVWDDMATAASPTDDGDLCRASRLAIIRGAPTIDDRGWHINLGSRLYRTI